MKKRLTALLMGITVGALCLSGCASTQEGGSSSSTNTDTGASNGEEVKLTFSHLYVPGESFNDVIVPAVEKFNKDYDGKYEINIDEMPQEAYLTQTNARGTADDLAEIVMVNGTMMKGFSDTGVIIPITEIVKETGIDTVLNPGTIEEGTNIDDGEVYSIPIMSGTYGFILYNTEIFEEVGIETFPKTLVEFEAACEKIKGAGYVPMGLGLKDLWAGDSLLFSSFVNNFVGNEWYESIRKRDGNASYNDPEFIEALKAYQNLAQKGYFNSDFTSISNDERLSLYLNKKVAMVSAGDWECGNLMEGNAEIGEKTKAAAWPVPENAKVDGSIVQSGAWGVAFGSKITDTQLKGAKLFLKDYFFTEESAETLFKNSNEVGSWKFEMDSSLLSTPAASMHEVVKANTPCVNWDATQEPSVKQVIQRGLQDLLMGNISPEELAQAVQDEYELCAQ